MDELIQKSLDKAFQLLDKVLEPSAVELGLLARDQIAYWRLCNQIRLLEKVKDLCSKHNITPKKIQAKLVYNFLEKASIEDDEYLQDIWAIMFSNMVDSEQNIDNNVLPNILSQLSTNELKIIDSAYIKEEERDESILAEIKNLKKKWNLDDSELLIQKFIGRFEETKIPATELDSFFYRSKNKCDTKNTFNKNPKSKEEAISKIFFYFEWLATRYEDESKEYLIQINEITELELANLSRLGLVKENIMVRPNKYHKDGYSEISPMPYVTITKLGLELIHACQEKVSSTSSASQT